MQYLSVLHRMSSVPQSFLISTIFLKKFRVTGAELHHSLGYAAHLFAEKLQYGLPLGGIHFHVDYRLLAGRFCDWAELRLHYLSLYTHSYSPLTFLANPSVRKPNFTRSVLRILCLSRSQILHLRSLYFPARTKLFPDKECPLGQEIFLAFLPPGLFPLRLFSFELPLLSASD